MKTFYVGVDISKEWLDFSICDESTMSIVCSLQAGNNVSGVERLIRKCRKEAKKSQLWFCFEHTGNFGLLLAHHLSINQIKYTAVPALEIKQSIGMSRGKNDKIDSIRIAQYAAMHKHKLKPQTQPTENLLKIKCMLGYRDQLVKISVQLKNSMKSYQIANKIADMTLILEDIKVKLGQLRKEIKVLEDTIEKAIFSCPDIKKNYDKAKSVSGIGLITAAYMVVCTNNFSAFENPRKFNCYAGIAPFEFRSGSSINGKTRTSKLRNRDIKKLLFNGANSAIIHDNELKAYYNRKVNQGKQHMTIINAVACKLVSRVFAVIKREQPFVKYTSVNLEMS